MRRYIIGDSIVRRLAWRKVQLAGGGEVLYHGQGGLRLEGLLDEIATFLYRRRFPTTLIIHCGTNNVLMEKKSIVRARVEEVLLALRRWLPWTRIIWSDVLPRHAYFYENKKGAGKMNTLDLNQHVHNKVCKLTPGMHYIRHSQNFAPHERCLFISDFVHLSKEGINRLLYNWEQALLFFNAYPQAIGHPWE